MTRDEVRKILEGELAKLKPEIERIVKGQSALSRDELVELIHQCETIPQARQELLDMWLQGKPAFEVRRHALNLLASRGKRADRIPDDTFLRGLCNPEDGSFEEQGALHGGTRAETGARPKSASEISDADFVAGLGGNLH